MAASVEQQNLDSRVAMFEDLVRRFVSTLGAVRDYIAGLSQSSPDGTPLDWTALDTQKQNLEAVLNTAAELIPGPPVPPLNDPNNPPAPPSA